MYPRVLHPVHVVSLPAGITEVLACTVTVNSQSVVPTV